MSKRNKRKNNLRNKSNPSKETETKVEAPVEVVEAPVEVANAKDVTPKTVIGETPEAFKAETIKAKADAAAKAEDDEAETIKAKADAAAKAEDDEAETKRVELGMVNPNVNVKAEDKTEKDEKGFLATVGNGIKDATFATGRGIAKGSKAVYSTAANNKVATAVVAGAAIIAGATAAVVLSDNDDK